MQLALADMESPRNCSDAAIGGPICDERQGGLTTGTPIATAGSGTHRLQARKPALRAACAVA